MTSNAQRGILKHVCIDELGRHIVKLISVTMSGIWATCGNIWESVMSQSWSKMGYLFLLCRENLREIYIKSYHHEFSRQWDVANLVIEFSHQKGNCQHII